MNYLNTPNGWEIVKEEGFNWGSIENINARRQVYQEVWVNKLYEKIFEVEEGAIVIDLGAGIGDFTWSIRNNKPQAIYCFEPGADSQKSLPLLKENTSQIPNCFIIEKFMSSIDNKNNITWDTFLKSNHLNKIDFVKTDCEGGEYEIFKPENIFWVKENIKKIVGEWHLSTPELKSKFRIFRDTYLRLFPNHEVNSVNGVDIKWDLWNEHFIEYYNEVIIYIDNR